MANLRPGDRASYFMICAMSVATIGAVLLTSVSRKAAGPRQAPSLDGTALEDRLKIFDKQN